MRHVILVALVFLAIGCGDEGNCCGGRGATAGTGGSAGRGGAGEAFGSSEWPVGPADTCTRDVALSAACICGGSEYTEGYCCDEGFSYSACSTTDLYAIPGGSGAKDGSDWANAFDGLPTSLVRDRVYWIGDGSYGTSLRTFDTAPSGSAGITIRKATEAVHGTETGWNSAYGDGQATFGQLVFSTGRYTVDGGEPNGIKSTVTGLIDGRLVLVSNAAERVVLRNMEMDGGTVRSGSTQTAGICTALQADADYIVVDRCELHDAADDGIQAVTADYLKVFNSKIHALPACGTDGRCSGPCFNGHSDGIELVSGTGAEIIGNMIYDILLTGGLFTTDLGGGPVRNLVLRNNILYTQTALPAHLGNMVSPRIYNNIIWGIKDGNRYGGFSVGGGVTDLEFYNNIVTNIHFNHASGTGYDSAEHHLDYNQFGVLNTNEYPGGANDQVGDPLFVGIPFSGDPVDHTPADLLLSEFSPTALSPTINQGNTSGPTWDIKGVSRPQGTARDMGVFEAAGTGGVAGTD